MSFFSNFTSPLGSIFGQKTGNSGGAGLNYRADRADLLQPTNIGQTDTGYAQSQQGIAQQMAFLNALQAQNGIGNQSNVFSQQQGLANQLQGLANGEGPNPALAQLNQTTGQNISNQAAMMAGQRGASANAGMMARQSAMRGGDLQQQATGQAAVLSAQQQLAAMNALQQQQANMANLATNQVGQQAGALGQYNQAAQNEQQQLLNSMANYNNANIGTTSNVNNANAGISGIAAQGQQGMYGGMLGGLSSAVLPQMGKAHGGLIQGYAEGGGVEVPLAGPSSVPGQVLSGQGQGVAAPNIGSTSMVSDAGADALFKAGMNIGQGVGLMVDPLNKVEKKATDDFHSIMGGSEGAEEPATQNQQGGGMGGIGSLAGGIGMMAFDKGGQIPHLDKGGLMGTIMKLAPLAMMALKKGGSVDGEAMGPNQVPGKAKLRGDSLKNDKVPAMLSPGEVVIPRSIINSDDPVGKSAQFVAAVMRKKGMMKKGS